MRRLLSHFVFEIARLLNKLLNTAINRFSDQFAKFSQKPFFLSVVFVYGLVVNFFDIANIYVFLGE